MKLTNFISSLNAFLLGFGMLATFFIFFFGAELDWNGGLVFLGGIGTAFCTLLVYTLIEGFIKIVKAADIYISKNNS